MHHISEVKGMDLGADCFCRRRSHGIYESQLQKSGKRSAARLGVSKRGGKGKEALQLCRSDLIGWLDASCSRLRFGSFQVAEFEPEVILLAVGWYLCFSLSYRDVEELLVERGLSVDHVSFL